MAEEVKNPGQPAHPVQTAHPSHTQVYDIIIGKDPSWQSIIYELISSEQLDPWNIDIGILCNRYFERVRELEEGNFHISSKILFAASLLLRIKSEILLNKYMKEIDNVLFGKDEETKKIFERIEIDENELPILMPRSPMPRFKKVTLDELMKALDTAIKTESRRIDRELEKKQRERLSLVDIPKFKRININERIRQFYARILSSFKHPKNQGALKLPYSHFTGNNKEEKIACFLPMLHLSNTNKLWIEQEGHYSEIYMYLFETFVKAHPDYDKTLVDTPENLEEIPEHLLHKIEQIEDEIEQAESKLDKTDRQKRIEKLNSDFENPIGDIIDENSE